MFVRNTWYMVGWSKDFPQGQLVPFTLMGSKLVLYRKLDGGLACLADRCSHRLAPLSMGTLEGEDVRCMYHGLKFDARGKNIDVPIGGRPSPIMNVRAYPVIERHGAAWVWTGDPAKADDTAIPNFVGVTNPDWSMSPGRMDYSAKAQLVIDNLLDLSHVGFVHRNSFLGGRPMSPQSVDGVRPIIEALPNGVRVTRLAHSVSALSMVSHRFAEDLVCDQILTYDFLVPGTFLMRHGMFPEGALARAKAKGLRDGVVDEEPLYDTFTCQAVTPLTDKSTCYFFAYGPWSKAAEDQGIFTRMGLQAFNEDRVVIEGQQSVIDSDPHEPMKMLGMDAAAVMFSRLVDKLLEDEATLHQPQVVADCATPCRPQATAA